MENAQKIVKDLLDYSLEELTHNMGNIQPKDLAAKEGNTMNLTWNQIIQAVNYAAKERVLTWKSTAKEALDKMARFLFPMATMETKTN